MNHIKVFPNSVYVIWSVFSFPGAAIAVVYVCLSFSSCLLGLWLPLWRCISPPWQQEKYAISSPDLPLLSKCEWGVDLLDTYISW